MLKSNQKNYNIETLRGIAILLVVAGHVIGSTPEGGMKIDYPSPFRYIYLWIDYIQMPLFTALAGWVYSLNPVKRGVPFFSFSRKKAIRLLIPMVAVGTLYFVMQYYAPGTNNKGVLSNIWEIYVFPYTIYWYLPSLFIMFITVYAIDINNLASTFLKCIGCFCIIFILALCTNYFAFVETIPNYFSFKGALLQMPYFMIGLAIHRFNKELLKPSLYVIYIIATIIGLTMMNMEWFLPNQSDITIYRIFVIFTLPLILSIKLTNKFAITIGKYAYSIYLFHVFFTGGVRIILVKLGVGSDIIIFTIVFILSVLFPILIDRVISINKLGALILLGKNK